MGYAGSAREWFFDPSMSDTLAMISPNNIRQMTDDIIEDNWHLHKHGLAGFAQLAELLNNPEYQRKFIGHYAINKKAQLEKQKFDAKTGDNELKPADIIAIDKKMQEYQSLIDKLAEKQGPSTQ